MSKPARKIDITQIKHPKKRRKNNPAVGLVNSKTEPYLNWAGKAEKNSFEVPTVSLHTHEKIDPT